MNQEPEEVVVVDQGKPLFLQIAESVEDQIVAGTLRAEERAPSSNELATFFRINPATAAKGVNLLVDKGVLYKRRGLGMYVSPEGRDRILQERRSAFVTRFLTPLLAEASKLGISGDELVALIHETRGTEAGQRSPHPRLPPPTDPTDPTEGTPR